MFTLSEQLVTGWISEALMIFFRLGGALMVAPMFGAMYVPPRVRLLLAAALSMAVLPLVSQGAPGPYPAFSPEMLVAVLQQLLIGIAAGLLLQMIFEAVTIGMQTVSMGMGLGFAIFVDNQSGIQIPTLSQLYTLLTMLIFLALEGHLAFLHYLMESFQHIPIGADPLEGADFQRVVSWAGQMFAGGLRIALPAATAGLIANISIGIISRAAPQLNLFAIGLPFTLMAGFAVLMLTLPAARDAFIMVMQSGLAEIWQLLGPR